MSTRARVSRAVASCVAAALGACAGSGEGLDANGRPIGENPPPAEDDFTQIQNTIFTPICTACHAGANAPVGLRLDAGNSYALLVGIPSGEVPTLQRVSPGNPDASYLVHKIEGRAAVGARMPLGGPPLTQAQIDLVRNWIAQGAPAPAALGSEGSLRVVATIPDPQDAAADAPREIVVVFNAALDPSLVASTVEIEASGADGGFAEGNEQAIRVRSASVSLAMPHVLRLVPEQPLATDTYRLRIQGSAPLALADVHGRPLESDFTATFQFQARPTP